jgi:hypothetical protein
VWGIGPEECTDFSRHFYGFVNAQSLQSLDVKDAVVKLALSAFVPVNTLSLAKHLFTHGDSPLLRAAPRERLNH